MKLKQLIVLFVEILIVSTMIFGAGGIEQAPRTYPTKTIQMIVPATPGGATDVSARLFAQYLTQELGQTVVVVNQDGAGGIIASETVRTARPDGYTILYTHTFLHTSHYSKAYQYSSRDFAPISSMSFLNLTFAVDAKAPWNNLADFVNDAKKNPGKFVVGVGLGGTTHFIAAALAVGTGIDFKMVDAGQQVERLAALQGGHLHMIVNAIGSSREFVKAGQMKVLAVASAARDSVISEFPTALEQGFDVVLPIMHTLYAPKDTPKEIRETINAALEKVSQNPEFAERLLKMGQNFKYVTVEETEKAVATEDGLIKILAAKLGF